MNCLHQVCLFGSFAPLLNRGRGFQNRDHRHKTRSCVDSKFFLCASGCPTSCLERSFWPKVYYSAHVTVLCEPAFLFSLVTYLLRLVTLLRPAGSSAPQLLPSLYTPERMNCFVACRRSACWISLWESCVIYQSSGSASYQHITILACLAVAYETRHHWGSSSVLNPLTLRLYYLLSYATLSFEMHRGYCWNCWLWEGCCRTY